MPNPEEPKLVVMFHLARRSDTGNRELHWSGQNKLYRTAEEALNTPCEMRGEQRSSTPKGQPGSSFWHSTNDSTCNTTYFIVEAVLCVELCGKTYHIPMREAVVE